MPEENIIPPSQDINVEITSWTPEEKIIFDNLRSGTTVPETKATTTPSPTKTLLK